MYSDGADYIGGGFQRTFDSANASIGVSGNPYYLTVSASGGTAGDSFSFDFAGPPGQALAAGGVYVNAQRAPFREAGHPGIDIGGSGRGCNTDTGLFEVKDIAVDSSGAIARLWIVYEHTAKAGRPPPGARSGSASHFRRRSSRPASSAGPRRTSAARRRWCR
jgi:hypothetical protein